jgi:uncharacterized membrane protein
MAHSHEARARSVVKALSWRALATLTTVTLVILYTGELSLAMAVGGTEVVAKMIIYYLHERAWALVDWGMKA